MGLTGPQGRGECSVNIKLRTIVKVLQALVLVVGLVGVIRQQLDYQKGQMDYSEAERLAGLPQQEDAPQPAGEQQTYKDPYAAALAETDLAALREVNVDVIGWICIPNIELSYPLLQGDDNDYYWNHTWKKEQNSVGSIF